MKYKLSELTIDGKGSYGIAASAVDYDPQKPTYLRITDINDDGTINFDGLKSVDDENSSKFSQIRRFTAILSSRSFKIETISSWHLLSGRSISMSPNVFALILPRVAPLSNECTQS